MSNIFTNKEALRSKAIIGAVICAWLLISACEMPQLDDCPDDDSTTCTVTVGSSVSGSIETAGDSDWFRVSLTGTNIYRIQLDVMNNGDFDVAVYNSTGNATGTGGSRIGNEDFTFQPDNSNTYYIRVYGYSQSTGNYTLQISSMNDDCLATTSTACTITPGSSVNGSIERAGDRDWFRVSLTGTNIYRIQLDVMNNGNFDVAVYNSTGDATGTRGSRIGNEDFTFQPDNSNTYYIRVYGVGSASGNYTLQISSMNDDCLATTSTACTITLGSSRSGSIERAGDRDWFKVPLTRGTTYRFQLDGPDGSNFGIGVYIPEWAYVFRYFADGDKDRTYRIGTRDGIYYIDVYGVRGTGDYTLTVTEL